MKTLSFLKDRTSNKGKTWDELGVNHHVGRAYLEGLEKNNNLLDFSNAIFESDVSNIIECLVKFKIKEITISSGFSGLNDILYLFQKEGFAIKEIVLVNGYKDFYGETKTLPACRLKKEDN